MNNLKNSGKINLKTNNTTAHAGDSRPFLSGRDGTADRQHIKLGHWKAWSSGVCLLSVLAVFLCASTGMAATLTATTSGSWNNNATWGNNPFPVAGDTANIPSGITVSIASSRTESCAALFLNPPTAGNSAALNFTDSGSILNVSGTVTIGTPNNGTGGTVSLSVDAGTFRCNALTFTDNGRDVGQVRISTGTVTVTNNVTMAVGTTRSQINFTGAGTLTVGGSFGGGGSITTASGCTVNYNGSTAQTVFASTYENLTLSGAGAKTLTSVTTINGDLSLSGTASATNPSILTVGGNMTLSGSATFTNGNTLSVAGNLAVGSGTTLAVGASNITVTGTSSVTGTLMHNSPTGTKTYVGAVTINSGGVWNNTGNAPINFRGGLTHNGTTFAAGSGVHTFDTSNRAIGGASAISIPNVTVTTVNLTNTGTLTVTTALAGTGTLINSGTGTLNINFGGAMGITTLTATAPGNTVNYLFAGAQTVKATSYDRLTLSGSGSKTTTSITVSNTLSMQGTATASATPTYGANATLEYAGSAAQTTGAELPSTIPNLKINNASNVNLNASATVSGTLVFTDGKLVTSANVLSIGTSGSISGADNASYVNGNLLKVFPSGSGQSFTFTVGDTNYAPALIASLNLSSGGNLTAKTTVGDHPGISTNGLNFAKSVNRYWTFTTGGGLAVSSCDATFNFIAGNVDAGASTSRFVTRRYSGSAWAAATTGTRAATSTTATGLNAFGDFAVGEQVLDNYLVAATSPQTAGAAFLTTVTARDILGVTVAEDSSTVVTMTGTGSAQFDSDGNGTFGDNTKTLTAGTFTISTKDNVAETVNLTATDANSKSGIRTGVVISPAAANKLIIQTQPSTTATAGAAFAQQPVIRIEDQFGNLRVSDNSTVVTASRNAGSGTLQGTLTATAVNGVATFASLAHNVATTISIDFTSGALVNATSVSILVSPAAADRLVFTTQPAAGTVGAALATQPVVRSRDAFGNNSTVGLGANKTVTLSLSAGTGPLQGTAVKDIGTAAGNGVASFTDLRLDRAGTDKQLTASASGLTAAVSSTFTVAKAATTTVAANQNATTSATGQNITFTVSVSGPIAVDQGTVTFTVKQGGTVIGTPVTSATVSGGAASAIFVLPGGTAAGTYTIEADYGGGNDLLASSDHTKTLTLCPAAPVANGDTLGTLTNIPVTVLATKLLDNDTGGTGATLTITAVSATSTQGGTVSLSGGVITYTPPAGFSGTDQFTYSLHDGCTTVSGTVQVIVGPQSVPAANLIGAPVAEAGGVRVRFGAIPGLTYTMQRSSNGLVWTALTSVVAPAAGIINYLDTSTTDPSFRYRIITP